ncbi:hypothetical protein ISN44_As06g035200 [Arabidopsis suecica]|uniref:Uncharacterized protein n=1 Tax=Arabidopsis suecica TaxID=45249 RepID=A0A8T2CIP4_ARASU|nr:hypothetical protein ISN44_As06g035200 [Arabidopsis suecica]
MGKSTEAFDSFDSAATTLVRCNSRFVRNPGNEAELSRSSQIKILELIDESDRVGNGGNSAVYQDDPTVGYGRFGGLIDLMEEPSNRPVYTEAEVEAKLIPLGVLTRDLSPVVDWNRGIVGVPTRSTAESVTRMLNSCEGGYRINPRCIEEMTILKAGKSLGTWVVNNRPGHKFIPGDKVSNFKNWERHYFFVRSDLKSSKLPLSGRRRMWNKDPDRHKPSREFPAKYEEIRSAIFRVQNQTWKDITRERVARIMGRVRRNFVSFAARLRGSPLPLPHAPEGGPSARDPINTSALELPEVTGGSAEGDLAPVETEVAGHTEDRTKAGRRRPNRPWINRGRPSCRGGNCPGVKTKSQEDKGKGIEIGENRNASKAGLPDDNPPRKTFCLLRDDPDHPDRFSFQYIGDKYMMRDQEPTSHLWCNMAVPGARAISYPDELIFSATYKKFARFSFETNALAKDLFGWCDRKLKLKYGDRDRFKLLSSVFQQEKRNHEELKKKYDLLKAESETHSAEVASLKDEVAKLGKREAELAEEVTRLGNREVSLMGEVAKLEANVAFSRDHDERELNRLRNDRFAKVSRTTQKAEAHLDKVKSYIKEQEHVVQPRMDAMNQSKGAQEIVTVLISRGAVVSEVELENLAKKAKIAEEEVDALNVIELSDADLNMSPDQLGFGLTRLDSQLNPESRRQAERFLSCVEGRHKKYRDLLIFHEDRQSELLYKLSLLESHPRDWLKNGFQRLAPMPDALVSYCQDCAQAACSVLRAREPGLVANGDFIPSSPTMFYLGPSVSKAESTESQNFVNLIGLEHQDQGREFHYFRIKKRKVDDRLEELEAEVAKLRAKRNKVLIRLDEIEKTTRALEIGSEDWEKVGLQLVWPMPDRLLRDNRHVTGQTS